jgi:hypothetical protein
MAEILSDDEIRAVVSSVPARPYREESSEPTSVRIARAVERAVVERLAAMGGELPEQWHTMRVGDAAFRKVYAAEQMRDMYARGVAAGMAAERALAVADGADPGAADFAGVGCHCGEGAEQMSVTDEMVEAACKALWRAGDAPTERALSLAMRSAIEAALAAAPPAPTSTPVAVVCEIFGLPGAALTNAGYGLPVGTPLYAAPPAPPSTPDALVADLRVLVMRMARDLQRTGHPAMADKAMDFLKRHGLEPSPLREEAAPSAEPTPTIAQRMAAQGMVPHPDGTICSSIGEFDLPAPSAEPVAWQWRRLGQDWSLDRTFNSAVFATTPDSEVRPLYAAPPALPDGAVEAMRMAVEALRLAELWTDPECDVGAWREQAIDAAAALRAQLSQIGGGR